MHASTQVSAADSAEDYGHARELFEEYAAQLGVDLCFQNFAFELDHLAEMYGPPSGCLLLGRRAGKIVGCVALRHLSGEVCELKRLYVRESARTLGLGRALTRAALAAARAIGYQRIVLDTLERMTAARQLYASLGFRAALAYYANPDPTVEYLALDL